MDSWTCASSYLYASPANFSNFYLDTHHRPSVATGLIFVAFVASIADSVFLTVYVSLDRHWEAIDNIDHTDELLGILVLPLSHLSLPHS
jgi:hypothetical protein